MKPYYSSFLISFLSVFILAFTCPALYSQPNQNLSIVFLDPHEFNIQMNLFENEVLIDVRSYNEFRIERINRALLASNSEELLAITDTLDFEQPLFIYCEEESRSITACSILIGLGFKQVHILKEGIIGWKQQGLAVDNSKIRKRGLRD